MKETMAQKKDIDIKMAIFFGRDNTTTAIKRMNCNKAARDLGVLLNPKGNFNPEYEQRRWMNIKITERTKRASLSAKNAYQLYQNI
eukprot:15331179-Ditylum_brightwellii.AAC.1